MNYGIVGGVCKGTVSQHHGELSYNLNVCGGLDHAGHGVRRVSSSQPINGKSGIAHVICEHRVRVVLWHDGKVPVGGVEADSVDKEFQGRACIGSRAVDSVDVEGGVQGH